MCRLTDARISAVDRPMSWTPAWMWLEICASPLTMLLRLSDRPLQVGAAVGADRRAQVAVGDLGRELGVAADRGLERLARVALDLGRIRELAVAFLGQRAQAHQRQAEPGAGGDERRGGEAERDLVDVVQRADEQDQQGQAGGDARDREAGARLLELDSRPAARSDPHRQREQEQRGGPGDRVPEVAEVSGADAVVEQRADVADRVEEAGRRHQIPARAPAGGHERRGPERQDQQQDVADRVDQVPGHGHGVIAGRLLDGPERERGERRGAGQRHDDAVEIVGGGELPDLLAHQHHHADVRQREEAGPQVVGQDRGGGVRVVDALVGHREVAERPQAHPDAEREAEAAILRADRRPDEHEQARDQLERGHAPAVEPGGAGAVGAHDQRDRVADEDQAEQGVEGLGAAAGLLRPRRGSPPGPRRRRARAPAGRLVSETVPSTCPIRVPPTQLLRLAGLSAATAEARCCSGRGLSVISRRWRSSRRRP